MGTGAPGVLAPRPRSRHPLLRRPLKPEAHVGTVASHPGPAVPASALGAPPRLRSRPTRPGGLPPLRNGPGRGPPPAPDLHLLPTRAALACPCPAVSSAMARDSQQNTGQRHQDSKPTDSPASSLRPEPPTPTAHPLPASSSSALCPQTRHTWPRSRCWERVWVRGAGLGAPGAGGPRRVNRSPRAVCFLQAQAASSDKSVFHTVIWLFN